MKNARDSLAIVANAGFTAEALLESTELVKMSRRDGTEPAPYDNPNSPAAKEWALYYPKCWNKTRFPDGVSRGRPLEFTSYRDFDCSFLSTRDFRWSPFPTETEFAAVLRNFTRARPACETSPLQNAWPTSMPAAASRDFLTQYLSRRYNQRPWSTRPRSHLQHRLQCGRATNHRAHITTLENF